ncbi:hypothetical protein TNCV_1437301 [Trichonephila clavipes]|nr:hypothetical protein TNCV_1437301 [Trichonephila clavipes]
MEKRAVIKFYAKLGKSASETYQLMKQVSGDCCLSRSNVFVWHNYFWEGRDVIEDDQRSGRQFHLDHLKLLRKYDKRLLYVIKNDERLFEHQQRNNSNHPA